VIPSVNGTALGAAKVAPRYYDGLVFMGTNDNNRGAAYAVRASDWRAGWTVLRAYPHGTSFTDVNGTTFDAGDTWTTKVTPNDTPNNCYLTGGAAPWQQGTIDPELGMIYIPFGNVRSCTGSQNGEGRPGDNPVRQLGGRARLQDRAPTSGTSRRSGTTSGTWTTP
jgi:glucose dehydrogenase